MCAAGPAPVEIPLAPLRPPRRAVGYTEAQGVADAVIKAQFL